MDEERLVPTRRTLTWVPTDFSKTLAVRWSWSGDMWALATVVRHLTLSREGLDIPDDPEAFHGLLKWRRQRYCAARDRLVAAGDLQLVPVTDGRGARRWVIRQPDALRDLAAARARLDRSAEGGRAKAAAAKVKKQPGPAQDRAGSRSDRERSRADRDTEASKLNELGSASQVYEKREDRTLSSSLDPARAKEAGEENTPPDYGGNRKLRKAVEGTAATLRIGGKGRGD